MAQPICRVLHARASLGMEREWCQNGVRAVSGVLTIMPRIRQHHLHGWSGRSRQDPQGKGAEFRARVLRRAPRGDYLHGLLGERLRDRRQLSTVIDRCVYKRQEDRLLTGSVDGKVRSFTYPENQFDAFITSAGAVPIRWLTIDKAGERVAVCSE
jgi:hypothetical protein